MGGALWGWGWFLGLVVCGCFIVSFGFSRVSGSLGVSAVLSGFAGVRWECRVLCALLRVADAFLLFLFSFLGVLLCGFVWLVSCL